MQSQLGPMPSHLSEDFEQNMILKSDSYKMAHFMMLPPNTHKMRSYVESRGGLFPNTIFFGPQMMLQKNFTRPISNSDINDAEYFANASGLPFNRSGWKRVVNKHGGYIPLEIKAVAEGSNVPILNSLLTVDSTDEELAWLTTYYEPMILRGCWYPSSVATLSWTIKQLIKEYMEDTCDNLDDLNYKLHDFGSRGVSSGESAQYGGAAHLTQFWGSDNMEGAVAAMKYYNCDVPLRSVPASEHSVTTIWGKENEVRAYENMLRQFAKPGAKISIVADSYDLFGMIRTMVGGSLKQQIIDSQAVIIIRPDSGKPHEIVLETINALMEVFGYTWNTKGYKVLPKYIRIIQGDGIEYSSINMIMKVLKAALISIDNIFFGMGGKLLQGVHRDTGEWADKVSEGLVDNQWIDVFKDPITDKCKKSKRGNQMLYRHLINRDRYITERIAPEMMGVTPLSLNGPISSTGDWEPVLETIYLNGDMPRFQPFDQVRDNTGFYQ